MAEMIGRQSTRDGRSLTIVAHGQEVNLTSDDIDAIYDKTALMAENARLSALVQGIETWLTGKKAEVDAACFGKQVDAMQWEYALSEAWLLALEQLRRLKGQP